MTEDSVKPKYNIIVVELDDVAPRRDSRFPNLFVKLTTHDIHVEYERIMNNQAPEWVNNHVLCLREDLCARLDTTEKNNAQAGKKALVSYLQSLGYTVNRNTAVWRVYVIELRHEDLPDVDVGYVYVGQTFHTPEKRLEQHLGEARTANGKASLSVKVVRDRFVRLAMELAPDQTFFSRRDSPRAESEWAQHLRNLGYKVEGGH